MFSPKTAFFMKFLMYSEELDDTLKLDYFSSHVIGDFVPAPHETGRIGLSECTSVIIDLPQDKMPYFTVIVRTPRQVTWSKMDSS